MSNWNPNWFDPQKYQREKALEELEKEKEQREMEKLVENGTIKQEQLEEGKNYEDFIKREMKLF